MERCVSGSCPGAHSHKPPLQRAVQAGPGPGLAANAGSGLGSVGGVRACVRAKVRPPTAASGRGRLQSKEWQFQAKAGRASWQSVSGLCNHLRVSSNVEDFAHLFWYARQREVAAARSLPELRSSVFHGKSCTIFIRFFFWDTFLPIGIFIFQFFC